MHIFADFSKPISVNFKGAQESIPPAYVAEWTVRNTEFSYRPARLGIGSWAH